MPSVGKASSLKKYTGDKKQFYIIAFPKKSGSERRDSIPPNDQQDVERAILLSLSEFEQGEISMWLDNQEVKLARNDLTLIPTDDLVLHITRLNDAIQSWGNETDWRRVSFSFKSDETGIGGVANLIVVDKRGRSVEYHYIVNENGEVGNCAIGLLSK